MNGLRLTGIITTALVFAFLTIIAWGAGVGLALSAAQAAGLLH
jgi:hypothetical protein